MKVYVPAFELVRVAVESPTELTVSLSLTETVNVTVSDWSLVLSSILLLVALEAKLVMLGGWLSTLLILTVRASVTLLPVVSVTVAVNVSLLSPKL